MRKSNLLILILTLTVSSVCLANEDLENHDTSQPINISSDSLEVDQEKKLATFTGKVEAIQGDINLRSDKMVVHYNELQADETQEKPENENKDKEQRNTISKIEVEGNVFLSTPRETAKGNEGLYDVDKDQVILKGDVVVTKGKNVVKGDHLVYDLVKGTSKMVSSGKDVKKTERVRGVFVPNEEQ